VGDQLASVIAAACISGIAKAPVLAISGALWDAFRARTLIPSATIIAATIHFAFQKTMAIRGVRSAGLAGLAEIFSAINLAFRHTFARHPRTSVPDAARAAVAAIVHNTLSLRLRLVGVTYYLVANHVGVSAIWAEAHHPAAPQHPLARTPARKKLGMSIDAKERVQKANEYGRD
jgi:hypothetical protein